MTNEAKQYIVGALALVAILGGAYLLKNNDQNVSGEDSLTAVNSISHGHGLAVDVEDSGKLYIATHYGLFVIKNDKDMYRIGQSEHDFMGFSPHPMESDILFASGHPKTGGNLGVQKSEDGGVTWQKISDGAEGVADFHAMTVSEVNPDIMYGYYNRALQRSVDGGYVWEIASRNPPGIISLTTDPEDENKVYAATEEGFMTSSDMGETWSAFSDELTGETVTGLGVNPRDKDHILLFIRDSGMMKSRDGGQDWTRVIYDFDGDMVLYVAFDRQNPNIVYTMTGSSSIFKSEDFGLNWKQIH